VEKGFKALIDEKDKHIKVGLDVLLARPGL
jgi:hypothetical protein